MRSWTTRIDLDTGGTIIEVPLTQGRIAIIDEADADLVLPHRWHAIDVNGSKKRKRKMLYAARKMRMGEERYAWMPDDGRTRRRTVYMHQVVFGGIGMDHINNDGLDNRRSNLREASVAQNNRNTAVRTGGSSPYKGVHWSKSRNCWLASITLDYRKHSLGAFADAVDAARAYDAAARDLFGEFAWTNFKT